MGIYPSGKIYGIKIYTFDSDETGVTLYEKKSDQVMNEDLKKEARRFYEDLPEKSGIRFQIFTECSSTYKLNSIMYKSWMPYSLKEFMETFQTRL